MAASIVPITSNFKETEVKKRGIICLLLILTATLVSFSPAANAGKPGGGTCDEAAIAVSYVKNTLGLTKVGATNVSFVSCIDPGTYPEPCAWAVTVTGFLNRVPEMCNILNTTEQLFGPNGFGNGCIVLGSAGPCTAS